MDTCTYFLNEYADSHKFRIRYCLGDNKICARYKVRKVLGKDRVPLSLKPNDLAKANEIISG